MLAFTRPTVNVQSLIEPKLPKPISDICIVYTYKCTYIHPLSLLCWKQCMKTTRLSVCCSCKNLPHGTLGSSTLVFSKVVSTDRMW